MSPIIAVVVILLGLLLVAGIGWRCASRRYALPCPYWLRWSLENPYVGRFAGATKLLDRGGVVEGMRVLDIGCGPGRMTLPAARRVGDRGLVVALDIQPAMLREVEERVRTSGATNVQTLLAGAGDGKLERSYFDRALLVAVLGEIPDRQRALREVHEALKPGGVLSVTEVFPDPHYQRRRTVRRLAENAGFQIGESFGNHFAFTLNLIKPLDPQPGEPGDKGGGG